MSRLFRTEFFWLLILALSSGLRAEVRILEVQPTALFRNTVPLRQVAWIHIENTSPSAIVADVQITVDGTADPEAQRLTIAPGVSQSEISMSDVTSETRVGITLAR